MGGVFIMFNWHIWTHVVQMHMWSEGSIILLASTLWFMHLWVWDAGLILNDPSIKQISKTKRKTTLAFSIMFFLYWMIALIATVLKIRVHGPAYRATESIIVGYLVWIFSPTAVLSGVFMWLDFNTTHDWEDANTSLDESDDESDDDKDSEPETD